MDHQLLLLPMVPIIAGSLALVHGIISCNSRVMRCTLHEALTCLCMIDNKCWMGKLSHHPLSVWMVACAGWSS